MSKFTPRPIRGANGYDPKEASDQACTTAEPASWGPSLTIQSQTDDADINILMERFGITGKMPENPHIPQYGDFEGISDYRTAIEAVRIAQESFMTIPAKVRAEFDNDPQRFLEFMGDPANLEKARSMGLAKPAPVTPAPEQKTVEPKQGTT